jgi:hypothetical protein
MGATARGAADAPPPPPPPPSFTLTHAPVPGFDHAHPSESLTLRATTPTPSLRVLILPGNPGAAGFYAPFAARLHARLGGAADVVSLSLHGHDAGGPGGGDGASWVHPPARSTRGRVTGLDGQVAHAAAAAAALAAHGCVSGVSTTTSTPTTPTTPTRLAIVGHSIGGLIALRAAAARASPDDVVIALMPYTRFNPVPQQRFLRVVTGLRPLRGLASAAAAGLGALPARAQALLLRLATGPPRARGTPASARGLAPHARAIVLSFLKAGGTAHALGLAATEFAALDGLTPEWHLLDALGDRGAVFFAPPGDHWSPADCALAGAAAAAAAAPDATVAVLEDQRHDFPVCLDRSDAAADAVADVLLRNM